ncbi:hypothetical protein [Cohnella sp.]|uniref:hypothetical protein n=1 Tax=Cohnella sp. TaxID=1883426 RepID=UPI0037044B57
MKELESVKTWLAKCPSPQNIQELQELRKILWNTLQSIDHLLETQETNAQNPHNHCPRCGSINVKGHGAKPSVRIYCVDCDKAFTLNRQPLYYRKRNRNTIIDLIVEIHTTAKSVTAIIKHLKISSRTYYSWKAEIISTFPQLEARFKNRRKKQPSL